MYRPSSALLALSVLVAPAAGWIGCGGSTNTNTDVTSPGDDAGDDSGSGDDAGNDSGQPTVVCTSGMKWTGGDRGSALMHPGRACIDCHDTNGGPVLMIGGTVYPTAHEPDDCDGVNGMTNGLSVVITDKNQVQYLLNVNSAGNFYSQNLNIATPFHAMVGRGCTANGTTVTCTGKTRGMVASQTTGDCNSCHTVTGAMLAPGRIQAP